MKPSQVVLLLAWTALCIPICSFSKSGLQHGEGTTAARPGRSHAIQSRTQPVQADLLADCDTLIMSDGSMRLVHFRRLTETEILFCECGASGDCEQRITRSEARDLRLSTGIRIDPAHPSQPEQANPTEPAFVPGQQKDSRQLEPLGIVGLVLLVPFLLATLAFEAPLFFLWMPLGLIFGIASLSRYSNQPGRFKARGVAILNIVLAAIDFLLGLLLVIAVLLFFL